MKLRLEKSLQEPWTINLDQRWIKQDRDQSIYYYCKIIKESYMVWRGKVWLLRKVNRKKDKDYTMIINVNKSIRGPFPDFLLRERGVCTQATQYKAL